MGYEPKLKFFAQENFMLSLKTFAFLRGLRILVVSVLLSQIQSVQRLNNGNNVSVIFFVTKNGQRIPATQAAENYNRLNKDQFARLVKLDVSF